MIQNPIFLLRLVAILVLVDHRDRKEEKVRMDRTIGLNVKYVGRLITQHFIATIGRICSINLHQTIPLIKVQDQEEVRLGMDHKHTKLDSTELE